MHDKRGSVILFGMMLALVVIITALALAPALSEGITNARNSSTGDTLGMDCSNASISSFQKAACYATDLNLFYFIGSLIFLAGGAIGAKILFQ